MTAPLGIGDVVATRFALEELLGAGGMGTVFRATDRVSGQRVAVKLLDHAAAERFEREAAALESLSHPAIVRYVAHGFEGAQPYLAMEWLSGEDLETRLGRGPLIDDEAIALGKRLAAALGAAHACGMVHRDVKPANVFLRDGRCDACCLVDFGVARATSLPTLTQAGEIVGTPGFMAPEQARGERTDARADVFSLGCVLYECVTGRPAFTGEHPIAILTKVLFEEVEPPADSLLTEAIMAMLSKEPSLRPADGVAAGAMLEHLSGRLARAPGFGRREVRLVTVLVTDGAGIEAANTVAQGPASSVAAVRVERLVGGGRVAVLSEQEATATDLARRAVRAALSLGEHARVVVATGRAVVARVPVGEVIDRAVRLLEEERERGVRLDETTASLVGARFELALRRGALYAIQEHTREPVRKLLGRVPPCVGRERELAALDAHLTDCSDEPRATAVVVSGPAGIGKSRLANEWLARAHPEAWIGRGEPMSQGAAFAVVGQMLRSTAGIHLGEAAEQARSKLLARVSRNVKDDVQRVAELLGEVAGVPFEAADGSVLHHARQDGQRMSDQVLTAWLDLLQAETAIQPLVLVLEDVHWADAASVRLCDAALRVLHARPLMVLAFAREGVYFKDRAPHAIQLTPLGKRATETFVHAFFPDGDARLAEQSQGNPLLLEELVRARVEGRDASGSDSVLAILQARLGQLPEALRRTLRAASVFGSTFWEGAVAELVDDTPSRLSELVERDVIAARAASRFAGQREYGFRHALVRDAVYAMLTGEDRVTAHRVAADWLEARGERDAATIAEHLDQAGEEERARAWYVRAAEQAYDGGSLDSAVTLAERATERGATGPLRGRMRLLQARAHFWRTARVEQVEAARAAAADLQAPDLFVALGLECGGLVRLQDREGALRAMRRFIAVKDESATCAATAGMLSATFRYSGFIAESEELRLLVERLAPAHAGDAVVEARLHYARCVAAKFADDFVTALDEAKLVAAAWERVGDAKEAAIARLNVASLSMSDPAVCVPLLEQTLRDAEKLGLRNIEAMSRLNLASVLCDLGRPNEARAMAARAKEDFGTDRHFGRIAAAVVSRATLEAGDVAGAEAEARAVLAETSADVGAILASTVLARVLLCRGDGAAALDALAPALAAAHAGKVEDAAAHVRLVHVLALSLAGDEAGAREALRDAQEKIRAGAASIADPSRHAAYLAQPDHERTMRLAL